MTTDRTTIQISVELWQWLNGRKQPGESFDDVLRRELEIAPEPTTADGGAVERPSDDVAENDLLPEGTDADAEQLWFRCGYCGTVFEVAGALAAHVEESHSEATIHGGLDRDHDVIVGDGEVGTYPCHDCDLTFDEWEEFAAHNEHEHGRDAA